MSLTSSSHLRMRIYNHDGSLDGMHQLVKEMGFVVGAHVVRKGDKTYAQIVGMENEFVLLNLADATDATGESHKVHCRSFLKKEWRKYTPKKEVETLSEHEKYYGVHQDEFIQMMIKHRIIEEMHDLGATHSMHDSDLQLEVKPSKGVIALKKYPKGKLILVPVSCKIGCTPESKSIPTQNIVLGALVTNVHEEKMVFSLAPHILLPKDDDEGYDSHGFLCPFWFIEFSDDPSKVNMEIFPDLHSYDQTKQRYWEAKPKIPVARNTRPIAENERLCLLKPKKDTTKNLEVISRIPREPSPEKGEGSAVQPAQKRRRIKCAP